MNKIKLYEKFNTGEQGLRTEQIKLLQNTYGRNVLPEGKSLSIFKIFFVQLLNPMIIFLAIAAFVSYILKDVIDAIFILIIIVVDIVIAGVQEWNAEKNAKALQNLVIVKAKVIRDGVKQEIDSSEVVIGDIVLLETGNKIGADIQLIETSSLLVDESILTGESIPVLKNEFASEDKSISMSMMVYSGTKVMSGRGKGIVTAIGIDTEIGKIAKSVLTSKSTKTAIVIRMEKFVIQITFIIAIIGIVIGIILWINNYPFSEIFSLVVAISVSAIPEGLPIALTIALSIAARKMAKKNVIIRKLNAVESLGSCTVIASDKTGTLTLNEQTVKKIYLVDNTYVEVEGQGYNDEGELNNKSLLLNQLVILAVLNNEGTLEKKDNAWIHSGDSMDVALLSLGYKNNTDRNNLQEYKVLNVINYESDRKYSAVFYEYKDETFVTVKGTYEILKSFMDINSINDFLLDHEYEKLNEEGYRVLALLNGKIEGSEYTSENLKNLSFLGFIAFLDPLRPDAIFSIKCARESGIRIMMITGDHPLTAKRVAKKLDFDKSEVVITGDKINEAYNKGETHLASLVNSSNVFARINPIEKMYIIESLTKQGEFVAVTGDGVNDAPAMKKAHISISMGSGTDVAKETSLMVIADDNFKSIVSGILEGRAAYDNIRKVIYLLISCGLAELLVLILSIIFKLPLPFLAIQILWLNLITNGIQDAALAFEAAEKDTLKRKPRDPKEKILDKKLISEILISGLTITIIVFGVWFYLINILNISIIAGRTYLIVLMVIIQNIHVFNCRSEYNSAFKVPIKNNYFVVLSVILTLLIQLVVIKLPLFNTILKITDVDFKVIIILFALSIPLLIVMEIYKKINKRH